MLSPKILIPLTVKQRHGILFNELDLSRLDPTELGCTYSAKHMIKVTDDTPFIEQFRQIPPPLVEEVWSHLLEMLESGTIRPSQSAWCNAVVLVRKKDGCLQFCINFNCLNTYTKKDSYPLLRIQEALKSLVGAGHFSCLDLKLEFWQIKMEEASEMYTAFTVGNLGFLNVITCPLGYVMHWQCFKGLCRIA